MFSVVPGYSCFMRVGQSLFLFPGSWIFPGLWLRFNQLESKTLDELSEKRIEMFPTQCLFI